MTLNCDCSIRVVTALLEYLDLDTKTQPNLFASLSLQCTV